MREYHIRPLVGFECNKALKRKNILKRIKHSGVLKEKGHNWQTRCNRWDTNRILFTSWIKQLYLKVFRSQANKEKNFQSKKAQKNGLRLETVRNNSVSTAAYKLPPTFVYWIYVLTTLVLGKVQIFSVTCACTCNKGKTPFISTSVTGCNPLFPSLVPVDSCPSSCNAN